MVVTDNCPVIANGSVQNAAAGLIKNKGDFHITNNFQIDPGATADGFASSLGNYRVGGNWVNSGVFTADNSTVFLDGGTQQITGTSVTTFHNLTLQTANSTKTQTINAEVNGILALNSNELATGDYNMTILNPSTGAITRDDVNQAFVSSTNNGRLIRNTNASQEYVFPTGIDDGGNKKIREVALTPTNSDARFYSVRFANNPGTSNTTTFDGYSIGTKESRVTDVNDVFYHLISSSDAAPAALSIYYNAGLDKQWKSIGRWQNNPQWEDLLSASSAADPAGSGRLRMTKNSWTPSKDQAHALINTIDVKTDFNFPSAFAPGSGTAKPEDTYFTIINQADLVTLDELSVFNRWGEMVFNSKRDGTDKWNGFYQGKLQQQANYTFLATVRNKQTGSLYPTVTGNVALIW